MDGQRSSLKRSSLRVLNDFEISIRTRFWKKRVENLNDNCLRSEDETKFEYDFKRSLRYYVIKINIQL